MIAVGRSQTARVGSPRRSCVHGNSSFLRHILQDRVPGGPFLQFATIKDRLGSLLNIIPQLETRYGEGKDDQLSFPNGFVLEVIGLTLNVTNVLRELGFSSFVETPKGFQARKEDSFVLR